MRISREYFFDLCELVGKAVTTARKRKAGPEWDMDEQIECFARRWSIDLEKVDQRIREKVEKEDPYGLFNDSGWKDSALDGHDGAVDEPESRREYSRWGSEAFEQKRAQRCYDDFGDQISCRLWKLMRQVQFKETKVMDAMKDLQSLCGGLRGYISVGWASRLANVIDQNSA